MGRPQVKVGRFYSHVITFLVVRIILLTFSTGYRNQKCIPARIPAVSKKTPLGTYYSSVLYSVHKQKLWKHIPGQLSDIIPVSFKTNQVRTPSRDFVRKLRMKNRKPREPVIDCLRNHGTEIFFKTSGE